MLEGEVHEVAARIDGNGVDLVGEHRLAELLEPAAALGEDRHLPALGCDVEPAET
jgi:hypothetical protein